MPKAYWIATYDAINDADKMKDYAAAAGPAVTGHGGTFLARGGRSAFFEGAEKTRVVVVEFPSLEAAEACYASDEYQAAHAKLGDGAERQLFAVEGAD